MTRRKFVRISELAKRHGMHSGEMRQLVDRTDVQITVFTSAPCVAVADVPRLGATIRRYLESLPARSQSSREEQSVYFVQSGEFVKIGISSGAANRLQKMQVGNPTKMEPLFSLPGGKEREAALHGRFRAYHHRGEWFRLEGELADFCSDSRNKSRNDDLETTARLKMLELAMTSAKAK
jgi:hypothetical protein